MAYGRKDTVEVVELICQAHVDTPKTKNFFRSYEVFRDEQGKIILDNANGSFSQQPKMGRLFIGNFVVPPEGRFKIWHHYAGLYKGEPQQSVSRMIPADEGAALALVLSGSFVRGIGPELATQLHKRWGMDAVSLLNAAANNDDIWTDKNGTPHNPRKALQSVKGIGPRSVIRLIASWRMADTSHIQDSIKDVMLGITVRQSQRLRNEYGEEYHDVIEKNPYALIQASFTFKECDLIAEAKGIAKDDPRRIEGAAVYALNQAMNKGGRSGDMFCTMNEAMVSIREILGADVKIEKFPVTKAIKVYDDDTITTMDKHLHDYNVAFQAAKMLGERPLSAFSGFDWNDELQIQHHAKFVLDPEQIQAIRLVASKRLTIVTGAPGSGKTAGVINPLLSIALSMGLNVVQSAPTGKAAVVMKSYTGYDADTNHMNFYLFDPQAEEWPAMGADLIILDECSMLPSKDLQTLLERAGSAHVVMVGDPWQLPPVGSGEPLLQLIESGLVPHVELKTIHRQKSGNGLIEGIHAIKRGELPTANEDFDIVPIRQDLAVRTIEKRVDWYAERVGAGIEDIMIVTPLNVTREAINKHFQAKYKKADTPMTPDERYCLGDKVIHLHNNRNIGTRGVMNGEVGIITYIDENDMVVSYGGKTGDVVYEYEDISYKEELDLAYAMTVHKSQGDQSPYVIAFFPQQRTSDHPLYLRQLWYVGASRARERGSVYYSCDPMLYLGNEKRLRRRSKLAEFLNSLSHV